MRSSGSSDKHRRLPSPSFRFGRKRAASDDLNSDESPSQSISELCLNSPQTESKAGVRNLGNHVCLCQPDPKVPRPRNAFILYRQHFQGQVIAQNPGLANPEISKIIGAQWRDQPVEVKNDWKRLAEEEKLRHQRQYPDYRYQPRRAGKPQTTPRATSQEDPFRCSKCSGRFISQPGTPLTSLPPATPQQASIKHLRDRTLPSLAQINEEAIMDNKRPFSPHEGSSSRSQATYQQQARHPTQSLHSQDSLQSPRGKRQRLDTNSPLPYSPNISSGPPSSRLGQHSMHSSTFPDRNYVHQMGQERRMQPPPFPTSTTNKYPQPDTPRYGTLSRNMDDVHLPPLRTAVSHPNVDSAPTPVQPRSMSVSASKSIEAMVMSIPFLNKIRVLSKIAPPLQTPGPASPVHDVRGPVIAVEGPDPKLVAEVGRYVEDYLTKEGGMLIRTWSEDLPVEGRRASAATASGVNSKEGTPPAEVAKPAPILTYLDSIRSWHPRSAEIRNFITTNPTIVAPTSPPPSTGKSKKRKFSDSPPCSPTSKPAAPPPPTESHSQQALLPVALLPSGFSLTLADKASCRIPIDDAYAPVDHWQWMATLWRGIIGADLTIYVNSGPREDEGITRAPPHSAGAVEVRMESRAVVIQCQNGKLDGGLLRRAGFEVGEWVRSRQVEARGSI